MDIRNLEEQLKFARRTVQGKSFETHPEQFKDIESIKVKIAYTKEKQK